MDIITYTEDLRAWGKTKPLRYVVDANGCWNCISHSDRGKGYRRLKRGDKVELVHRYIYQQEKGVIPSHQVVMHKCDNRACMNPDHLVLGSLQDNYQDAKAKGRNSKGEVHGMSKLTEEQVLAIRSDPRQGTVIAKEYGVTPALISNVRLHKVWSWL